MLQSQPLREVERVSTKQVFYEQAQATKGGNISASWGLYLLMSLPPFYFLGAVGRTLRFPLRFPERWRLGSPWFWLCALDSLLPVESHGHPPTLSERAQIVPKNPPSLT